MPSRPWLAGRRIAAMTSLPPLAGASVCFGDFVLDVANARLSCKDRVVELPPKAFELLAHLAQRPGELVLKDTLLDAVWQRRFVSEGAVKTVVSELRAALGDDARAPRWIETVQRRGYRFVGQVRAASASPMPPAAIAAAGDQAAAPGNLPLSLPATIAREAESAALDALLASHRLVTLTGTAGVGKTRLALARADTRRAQHADGTWLLELAPLAADTTDTATLRATLTGALRLAPSAAASNDALARALRPLSLLLVVDNAEHLLDVLSPLLAHLHMQVPQLRLLVTSREPMQVSGEQVLRLQPLAVPPPEADDDPSRLMLSGAVRLFVQRVAARLPGFELAAAQRRAVAALCRALDGLPLALELAAARVPVLGVHGLAKHLAGDAEAGARLQLLTHGARSAAPHQRTLRATLDWSHALLTPAQQRVFRRLAVFRGGFTLESAQIVCADERLDAWGVLDALHALVEKSMLIAPAHGADDARLTQLESLHDYAFEQLVAAGELEATSRRHLRAMCDYWARADARSLGDPALAWASRHGPEIDNLRRALRWAGEALARQDETELADELLALVAHSGALWHRVGLAAEGARWCAAVRERAERHGDARLRGGVALALATLSCYSAALPPAQGLSLALAAVAAFEQAGDGVREYFAHYLAWVLMQQAAPADDRAPHIVRMQLLEQPGWSALLTRFLRASRANELRLQGRHDAFLAYSREELVLFQQLGAQWESWVAAHALMLAEHDLGRPDAALAVGRELLADIRSAGRMRQNAMRLSLFATMLAESGDVAGTRSALAEAVPVLTGAGMVAFAHLAFAWLALHEDRSGAAARLLGWFDSPKRSGGQYGPGTYVRRSCDTLARRLESRLGTTGFAELRGQGDTLGDEAALSLGLGPTSAFA